MQSSLKDASIGQSSISRDLGTLQANQDCIDSITSVCSSRHHQFRPFLRARHKSSTTVAKRLSHGVVTPLSISTGREAIDDLCQSATSREITFPPRHSSVPYLESPECVTHGSSSSRIQTASTEKMGRRRKCRGQSQQLFPAYGDDARHVCRA